MTKTKDVMYNRNLKLFRVTCNSMFESLDVFIIAKDEKEASGKSLKRLKILDYKFDNYVSNVKLIADEREHTDLLIVDTEADQKDVTN